MLLVYLYNLIFVPKNISFKGIVIFFLFCSLQNLEHNLLHRISVNIYWMSGVKRHTHTGVCAQTPPQRHIHWTFKERIVLALNPCGRRLFPSTQTPNEGPSAVLLERDSWATPTTQELETGSLARGSDITGVMPLQPSKNFRILPEIILSPADLGSSVWASLMSVP